LLATNKVGVKGF